MFAVACMCGFLLFESIYKASVGAGQLRGNPQEQGARQSVQESLEREYERNQKFQAAPVSKGGAAAEASATSGLDAGRTRITSATAASAAVASVLSLKKYKVLVSDTDALREKGLGDRQSLDPGAVMLFVFGEDSRHYFWMKDMAFSIDMVWLDKGKKILHIERSVSPETYPEAFGPKADSRYVLEFSAGAAARENLKIGEQVIF